MAEPRRTPQNPGAAPFPVHGAPAKGILVDAGKKPVRRPRPAVAPPPPPQGIAWSRVLWRTLLVLIGVAIFLAGMELGYWRADQRYEPALREQQLATKQQADALADKQKELADKQKELATALARLAAPPPVAKKNESAPVAKKAEAKSNNPLIAMLTKPAPATPKQEPKTTTPPPATAAVTPPMPKSTKLVRFEQVLPIFQAKCTSCHGMPGKKAGLDLRTAAAAKRGGKGGLGVDPGKLDGSILWEYLADDRMPPNRNNRLTASEKMLVRDWILQGAK